MSFPYVTDLLNALFGTQWYLPVPMFGVVVLIAVLLSTLVFGKEVARREMLGVVPGGTRSLVLPMLDAAAPAMMLGYAIGRLGCQLSGDGDWGIAADFALKPNWLPDWLWAQTYENNIAGVAIPPPGVYPTPLYEIAMALTLAWLLWTLRSQRHRAGFLFSEVISFVLVVAGCITALVTLRVRGLLPKAIFTVLVLTTLSACVYL
jgi:prolipoprotein diacylglyceryltransferase